MTQENPYEPPESQRATSSRGAPSPRTERRVRLTIIGQLVGVACGALAAQVGGISLPAAAVLLILAALTGLSVPVALLMAAIVRLPRQLAVPFVVAELLIGTALVIALLF